MKCENCGSTMHKYEVRQYGYILPAWECDECGQLMERNPFEGIAPLKPEDKQEWDDMDLSKDVNMIPVETYLKKHGKRAKKD